jgi:hypothetical protein
MLISYDESKTVLLTHMDDSPRDLLPVRQKGQPERGNQMVSQGIISCGLHQGILQFLKNDYREYFMPPMFS